MGRHKNPREPKRVPVTLIKRTRERLESLVDTGGYGNNATDAVRIIIMRHLQELDKLGRIHLFPEEKENPAGDKG